jgi:precorrin-6B methylase 2
VCLAAVPVAVRGQDKTEDGCRLIYVPTEQSVVDKMLDMAKVNKNDIVFDLGCGDGRIVCAAAKNFGAKGVGIDYNPERIKDCMQTMKKFGVTKEQVDIRQGDALKVKDLNRATVIMLYMLPEFMEKLEPQLAKLKPGTRIVAHDYPFPNMKADQIVDFRGPSRDHTLYMWTLKKKE